MYVVAGGMAPWGSMGESRDIWVSILGGPMPDTSISLCAFDLCRHHDDLLLLDEHAVRRAQLFVADDVQVPVRARERTSAAHRSLIRCAIARRMSNSDGTDESSCTLTEPNLSDPSGAVSR